MGLQLRTVTFKGQERKKYQRDPDKRETKNQVKEILGGSKGENVSMLQRMSIASSGQGH